MNWQSPKWFYDYLDKTFKFGLDACASAENAQHKRYFTEKDNALKQNWAKKSRGKPAYMNPPYGKRKPKAEDFLLKAYEESNLEKADGIETVCLIPARTDTYLFHGIATLGGVVLLAGRLTFVNPADNSNNPAPFPSAIVVFSNRRRLGVSPGEIRRLDLRTQQKEWEEKHATTSDHRQK